MSKLLPDLNLDMTGIKCPIPLLKTKMALKNMGADQILWVQITDQGTKSDITRFIEKSAHRLLSIETTDKVSIIKIKVGCLS